MPFLLKNCTFTQKKNGAFKWHFKSAIFFSEFSKVPFFFLSFKKCHFFEKVSKSAKKSVKVSKSVKKWHFKVPFFFLSKSVIFGKHIFDLRTCYKWDRKKPPSVLRSTRYEEQNRLFSEFYDHFDKKKKCHFEKVSKNMLELEKIRKHSWLSFISIVYPYLMNDIFKNFPKWRFQFVFVFFSKFPQNDVFKFVFPKLPKMTFRNLIFLRFENIKNNITVRHIYSTLGLC